MDGYTIAFGIRNVTHIEKVLSESYRWAIKSIISFYNTLNQIIFCFLSMQ